jgi:hypothetical protein
MISTSHRVCMYVIPAKGGIHFDCCDESKMDSGVRRNDGAGGLRRNDGREGSIGS